MKRISVFLITQLGSEDTRWIQRCIGRITRITHYEPYTHSGLLGPWLRPPALRP